MSWSSRSGSTAGAIGRAAWAGPADSRLFVVRWEVGVFALLLAEIVILALYVPGFYNGVPATLQMSTQFLAQIVVAVGLLIPILGGGIDLSVGSNAGMAGIVCATTWHWGLTIWLAVPCALCAAALVGLINGLVIEYLKVPSFIATLGALFALDSIGNVIVGTASPYLLPNGFTAIANGSVGGVPIEVIVVAPVLCVMWYVAQRSRFGRETQLIGQNLRAARYAMPWGLGV